MNQASLPIRSEPQSPHSAAAAMQFDARTYRQALACVHCGLCLPACPTYTQTLHEADSPRGASRSCALHDGAIDPTESIRRHLDLCLDCRACETACPSGVIYHELIEASRAQMTSPLTPQQRLMRWFFFNVFPYPARLKLALLPARVLQKLRLYPLLRRWGVFKLLPELFQKMEQMLPPDGPLWPGRLPQNTLPGGHDALFQVLHDQARPSGDHKVVGFFAGCIGSVMFQHVNRQAARLLSAAGARIVCPPGEVCCGAIHHHNGDIETARQLARRNIDAFCPRDGQPPDWIATNIAGCGAMLREYDDLLRDDPAYAERARDFSARVRDISQVLLELELPPMRHPIHATATYHDACHLAHAQKVTDAPRQLLARIPSLRLVPLPESDMCCGAAGTYNLTQPTMSRDLATRKLDHIAETHADLCITGNVGCAMQIQSAADSRNQPLRVVHPVELLHQAVFGEE